MLKGSSALLGRLCLTVLVRAHCPELTSALLDIFLAPFCSCCRAYLLEPFFWASIGVWIWAPWSAVLRLSQSGSHLLRIPLAWAWSSALLGLVPGLMTGLQCCSGGGFSEVFVGQVLMYCSDNILFWW